ncbi:hypothetical protein DXD68_01605 [Parabacteroides sp. TM07-1AC]|nr:hypothetical protein DXD68_01605 [Parabacteroides sp. TM07-1AC]
MFVPYNYEYTEMLHQFITIYTSELLTTMLLGVLILLCLPLLIPVISDSVFAGEQKRLAESNRGFTHHIVPDKSLIRNYSLRLG